MSVTSLLWLQSYYGSPFFQLHNFYVVLYNFWKVKQNSKFNVNNLLKWKKALQFVKLFFYLRFCNYSLNKKLSRLRLEFWYCQLILSTFSITAFSCLKLLGLLIYMCAPFTKVFSISCSDDEVE